MLLSWPRIFQPRISKIKFTCQVSKQDTDKRENIFHLLKLSMISFIYYQTFKWNCASKNRRYISVHGNSPCNGQWVDAILTSGRGISLIIIPYWARSCAELANAPQRIVLTKWTWLTCVEEDKKKAITATFFKQLFWEIRSHIAVSAFCVVLVIQKNSVQ